MNLNRLKGSGLLIDGLNDFVRSWFGVEQVQEKARYTVDQQALIDRLPSELVQLYEIGNCWPQLGLGHRKSIDRILHDWVFEGYPAYFNTSRHEERYDERFLLIATFSPVWQEPFCVVYGLEGEFEGLLLGGDDHASEPALWGPISTPLDEVIVTMILMNIVNMFYQTTRSSSLDVNLDRCDLNRKNLLFSGKDPHNTMREFHFFPEYDFIAIANSVSYHMNYGRLKTDIFDAPEHSSG